MSSFGKSLVVTTFGESHGSAVGCVVDGLPSGWYVEVADVQRALNRRKGGQSRVTTQRREADEVEMLSGLESGITLGTPIAMMVRNQNIQRSDYAAVNNIPRPGHADYTYKIKYGVSARSGGGRASARETVGRVMAGSLAEKWLHHEYKTRVVSWASSVADVVIPKEASEHLERCPPTQDEVDELGTLRIYDGFIKDSMGCTYDRKTGESLRVVYSEEDAFDEVNIRCPHPPTAVKMAIKILMTRSDGDTIGGVITGMIVGVPIGIGEPCFDKFEAELGKAMLSIPAVKGFEIGEGFGGTLMRGSEHNDVFISADKTTGVMRTDSNHAGGTLGGIATGSSVIFRVAFKPVSSIGIPQYTCDYNGICTDLVIDGRHDPCVVPRAPPIVDAMSALVTADLTLRQRARVGPHVLSTLRSEEQLHQQQ